MRISEIEGLEEILRDFTDSHKAIDQALAAANIGVDLVPAFRCSHSGKYFPGDYLKRWGKDVGIGLGHQPVSECLDSVYEIEPSLEGVRSIEQLMHPLTASFAQVDFLMVPRAVLEGSSLVLAKDDPRMEKRAAIVRENQLRNPMNRLTPLVLKWQKGAR